MAHNLTIRADGFVEGAFVGVPWHSLGQIFTEPQPSDVMMERSGTGWWVDQHEKATFKGSHEEFQEYLKDPLVWIANNGNPWDPDVDPSGCPTCFENVRQDTGLKLATVSKDYQVVQNVEAFQFLDALVENGDMLYESAFSLRGGRQVVMLARMPGCYEVVIGDQQVPFIMMSLDHQAKQAVKFGPTMVRIVCDNTYRVALREGEGRTIYELAIRHSGNVMEKLADAKAILAMAHEKLDLHNERCQELAKRQLTASEWIEFLDIVCPVPKPMEPDFTERRRDRILETRSKIRDNYHGETTAPFTAWAAFNAFTGYVDHLPRKGANDQRRAEARFNMLMFGKPRNMKRYAFEVACRFANVPILAG